ncbi:MAG TPA: hypothetical protein VH682_21510 [Gemmataceae bacterium]|jgi:hypothetical protein
MSRYETAWDEIDSDKTPHEQARNETGGSGSAHPLPNDIYSHLTTDMQRDAADRLDALLSDSGD